MVSSPSGTVAYVPMALNVKATTPSTPTCSTNDFQLDQNKLYSTYNSNMVPVYLNMDAAKGFDTADTSFI